MRPRIATPSADQVTDLWLKARVANLIGEMHVSMLGLVEAAQEMASRRPMDLVADNDNRRIGRR